MTLDKGIVSGMLRLVDFPSTDGWISAFGGFFVFHATGGLLPMNAEICNKISSIFGDDVQNLHGNLFRVKRSRIRLSKQGIASENGKLVYGNPRWHINRMGEQAAKGMDKAHMDELRNSIQDEGLENPIRLRVVEDGKKSFLEVINGERRFRCVEQLCERNVPCFDSSEEAEKPASEIYEWIDCRIDFMDDKTALRIALKPNATSEIIGEAANIHVVKTLRDSGFDDQEILKLTGKSISWLRETEKIIGLDSTCLEHFEQDKINRTVALHLALVENADERLELLEKIKESAQMRHSQKIKKVEEKKAKAEEEIECEEAAASLAEKYGDEEAAEAHSSKSEKAKKRAKAMEGECKSLASKPAKATSKDLDSSAPLSHKKIKSLYVDLISSIIEGEGFDEDGNSYGLNLELLAAVGGVLSAVMEGKKDSMDVLVEHCSLVIEDEEIEDSDNEDDYAVEDSSDDIDEEYEEEEEDEDGDEYYEEEDVSDEYETPMELEKEFEEASVNDEEDFD